MKACLPGWDFLAVGNTWNILKDLENESIIFEHATLYLSPVLLGKLAAELTSLNSLPGAKQSQFNEHQAVSAN